MKRTIGVTARGIRLPVIKKGSDLSSMVIDSLVKSSKSENFNFENRDIVGITESVVARAQGNYVSVDDVAEETKKKFGRDAEITIFHPIFSRNRFSMIMMGIARGCKKINLVLGYPSDEVGNVCFNHPFTGINYDTLYQDIINKEGCEVKIFFDNILPSKIDNLLVASIHSRFDLLELAKTKDIKNVFCLHDFCSEPNKHHGHNELYGLLGSNKASENMLKLFPRDCKEFVLKVQRELKKQTNKVIEVMIYGDGAYKDPVSKIWEFADPVVSPAFTEGLVGTPNEIKMKYIIDTHLKKNESIEKYIISKESNLVGNMKSQGTTPRNYTDLLGSLCDLISGSGDKGTPVVLVQGYFDNYATK